MPAATLTRIRLNLAHRAVRRDLADHPGLHKTLMRLVPGHHGPHPRRQAGLLFRLEPEPAAPTLMIQTTRPPDLTALPAGYGTAQTRDLAPLLRALQEGHRVHYRITASPCASRPGPLIGHRPDGKPLHARGKPTALKGADAIAWWQRRAARAGLTIHSTTLTPRSFARRDRNTPGPYHHLTQFDGAATITDPHALADALCTGIGRGQAYGAGLLSLAPA